MEQDLPGCLLGTGGWSEMLCVNESWEESDPWAVSPGNLSSTLVRVKGDTINNHMDYLSPAQWEER